ncbi:tape measure protein [Paenibacillus sp. M1]|uniref:Tape measure protein n=1 Tax=Paenibacillus haidiansis TaxID=1574488 RepID=A0ABU7VMD3_9BACL
MPTMSTALQLYDGMSNAVQVYDKTMRMVQSYYKQLDSVSTGMHTSITPSVKAYKELSNVQNKVIASETNIAEKTKEADKAQSNFGAKIKQMGIDIPAAYNKAKSAIQQLKPAMDFSDAYVNTFYQLDKVNDNLQTTDQLHNKVFAAAQRSRGDYMSMANSVAEMGKAAPNAFKSNDELIAFQELLQKSYRIDGASEADQQSATGQLTQVMAAGQFQGSDFSSMMEYAPVLADAVSRYTGMSKTELQSLSDSGALSSDVIKNAMFAATDEINGKFSEVPKTFSDHFTNLKNTAIQNLDPIISKVSEILNSPAVGMFMSVLGAALDSVFSLFDPLISGAEQFIAVITDNLPLMAGLLTTIAAVIIPQMIIGLWNMVEPLLIQVGQWMLINWPILLIAGLIGLLVGALLYFGVSAQEIVGTVVAVFFGLYAHIYNIFALVYNLLVSFVEFWINLFIDPVYAIKKLIYDLAMTFGNYIYNMLRAAEDFAGGFMKAIVAAINGVLKGIDWLLEKINNVFGTNYSVKGQFLDETNSHAISDNFKSMMDSWEAPVSDKNVVSLERMEYKVISDFSNKGYDVGVNGYNSLANYKDQSQNPSDLLDASSSPFTAGPNAASAFDSGGQMSGLPGNIPNVGRVNEIGSVEEEVEISSEDLKMMRELAEMKSIQNFVSLTPTVQVTTGPVSNEANIDMIVARIEQTLEEEIASSAAGVYA